MSESPANRIPDDAPTVLSVRSVGKSFAIPDHKVNSIKELALHPFRRVGYRRLEALHDISFDVRQGEFFGIVGRNGSGKSTLLKIMASIYKADAGEVWLAGRMAPFIELGVGFDPELNARENVVLNGVMMGLTPAEAKSKVEEVIEFAELEEFAELKVKNFSSGMLVRLAFSVMIQAEADVLLIDEVLAVGDAAFQQKCSDVFHDLKRQGKTIVLVTHDMSAVESFCDRAMLVEQGTIHHIGDPQEVGRRYMRMNFEDDTGATGTGDPGEDEFARLISGGLVDDDGQPVSQLEVGTPLRIKAEVEVLKTLERPVIGLLFTNQDGIRVFGGKTSIFGADDEGETHVEAGARLAIDSSFENRLTRGRYSLGLFIARESEQFEFPLAAMTLPGFMLFGTEHEAGVFRADGAVDVEVVE